MIVRRASQRRSLMETVQREKEFNTVLEMANFRTSDRSAGCLLVTKIYRNFLLGNARGWWGRGEGGGGVASDREWNHVNEQGMQLYVTVVLISDIETEICG